MGWLRRLLRRIRCAIKRLLAPNEVSTAVSECTYGWTSAYNITSNEGTCTITVVVRIRLDPDADVTAAQMTAARTRWETAIEAEWTNRFAINRTGGECACRSYRVNFDVQFVNAGQHHTVHVQSAARREDMTNWSAGTTGATAAHEFGHMLGFADEYANASCPDRVVTADNSIMQTTAGDPQRRHYQPFAQWISNRLCCEYAVA